MSRKEQKQAKKRRPGWVLRSWRGEDGRRMEEEQRRKDGGRWRPSHAAGPRLLPAWRLVDPERERERESQRERVRARLNSLSLSLFELNESFGISLSNHLAPHASVRGPRASSTHTHTHFSPLPSPSPPPPPPFSLSISPSLSSILCSFALRTCFCLSASSFLRRNSASSCACLSLNFWTFRACDSRQRAPTALFRSLSLSLLPPSLLFQVNENGNRRSRGCTKD